MKFRHLIAGAAASLAVLSTAHASGLKESVDKAIEPLLKNHDVPGMAVAVSINGQHHFFNYGVASRQTQQPVGAGTLFEIGSVSKTFTATLAAYAQVNRQLLLSDKVSQHLPYLRGSSFDRISLMNLGTHTAGNFPLQLPDHVTDSAKLMDYYKQWKPAHAAGTHRTYSNPGIGLLGVVTAKAMNMPYAQAMETVLLPKLGLKDTFIVVPAGRMADYAQGYNRDNVPVRVNPAVLEHEAYGVKTTSADLIRFVDANMGLVPLDDGVQRALAFTHKGYFKAGHYTQALVWEQYPGAARVEDLLSGNSAQMTREINPVEKVIPPQPPQADMLINKTGATGGFSAYALYHPATKVGIVMLANRGYPGDQRVAAAYQILREVENAQRESGNNVK